MKKEKTIEELQEEQKEKLLRDFEKMKNEKYTPAEWNRQALIFARYADKKGFVINPIGIDLFVKDFLEMRCCVCRPERKNCPCPEAEEEVKMHGHCACKLFWSNYTRWVSWFESTCEERK